ncbi:MAG: hypothetical protein M1828_002724 [Chrysothrix sp. TS-e1954]|nr:MAG: hypothetical protein M1828_002724 [Chrysothrix sp. TS-e1954]
MAKPQHDHRTAYGGLGPTILGVIWTEFSLATLLVGLQTYSRLKLARFALPTLLWTGLAWVAAFVAQVIVTLAAANGLGNHQDLIPHANEVQYGKLNTVWEIPSTFAIGFSKMAAVALLLSLQAKTRKKWGYFLIFLGVTNLLGQPVSGFMAIFDCEPANATWKATVDGHCMPTEPFGIYTFVFSAWSAFCDFFLALYPISLFYESNMRLRLKLGLYRISETTDSAYSSAPLVIWQFTEMWIILMCLSVPALRPLAKHASEVMSSGSVRTRLLPSSLRRRFARGMHRLPSSANSDERSMLGATPSIISSWTVSKSAYPRDANQEKALQHPKSIEDGLGTFKEMELRPESNTWDFKTIQALRKVVTRE